MRARSTLNAVLLLATFTAANPRGAAAQLAPIGSEFRVNTITVGEQRAPDVGIAADGSFVVAWDSAEPRFTVRAQRFTRNGLRLGAEILVDPETAVNAVVPRLAVEADGDFLVLWQTHGIDSFGRFFDRAGVPRGDVFQVSENSYWSNEVAMSPQGSFVVAWQGYYGSIALRRFDHEGVPAGEELEVRPASSTGRHGFSVDVAMDGRGGHVLVWDDRPRDRRLRGDLTRSATTPPAIASVASSRSIPTLPSTRTPAWSRCAATGRSWWCGVARIRKAAASSLSGSPPTAAASATKS